MRGHIRKRGKSYSLVIDVGRDVNGRRKQEWSTYPTRKEAERALADKLTRLDQQTYVSPSRQTFGEFLQEWLGAIRTTIRPSTWESYEWAVRTHVVPRMGGTLLRRVSAPALNALYADLLATGRVAGGGLNPRSVQYVHTIVHRALRDAVRWSRLPRNVADQADPPRRLAVEMRTWTADQLRAFLESVRSDRLYAAWLLASTTGMRRGEVLGLRWQDVDLEAGRVSVSQTSIRGWGYEVRRSSPKTAKGRRSVALDPGTVAALRDYRKQQIEERMSWGAAYQESGLVFTKEDGSPVHPDRFSKVFQRHIRAAGLPRIRLHDLRHTWASLALQAGVHPKVVSERLGHANISITLDTYSHVIPAMQEDAAAKVAGLILGAEG